MFFYDNIISNLKIMSKQSKKKNYAEYVKILEKQTIESIEKWLSDQKITSYSMRNQKSTELVNFSIHILEKMLINQDKQKHTFLELAQEHHRSHPKIIQICKLLRHFAIKDYEFQFLLEVARDKINLDQVGLYLRTRHQTMTSFLNKSKKQLLTAVSAQLEQWFKISKIIFKSQREKDLTELFTTIVKEYYVENKKDQNLNLNGSQFFKVCQHIFYKFNHETIRQQRQAQRETEQKQKEGENKQMGKSISRVFDQSILNGLKAEDRELIRVLAFKDNNIAKMLEHKHNKMISMIAEDVEQLRYNIEEQKKKQLSLIQQKKSILKKVQKIKQMTLQYVLDRSDKNVQKLLSSLDKFCQDYDLPYKNIAQVKNIAHNRRLIAIIQKQQAIIQ